MSEKSCKLAGFGLFSLFAATGVILSVRFLRKKNAKWFERKAEYIRF